MRKAQCWKMILAVGPEDGRWGTCLNEAGQPVLCGAFGIDPATGLYLNGDQVCAQEGKTCLYVTPDGGVKCDQ